MKWPCSKTYANIKSKQVEIDWVILFILQWKFVMQLVSNPSSPDLVATIFVISQRSTQASESHIKDIFIQS